MTTTSKRFFYIVCGFALGCLLIGANPAAAQDDCRAVFDASTKIFDTPVHGYVTMVVGGSTHLASEMIYVGGVSYLKSDGKWGSSPMSLQDLKQLVQKNIQTNKTTCRHLKDESVNGELAAVYSVHEEASKSTSDSQIWISKAKGLLLRSEQDLDAKTHITTRYEYGNVKPPM